MPHRRLVRLFAGVFATGASAAVFGAGTALASPPGSAPTLTTQATSAVVQQPIYDTATLSGGSSPTGSITWNLYKANTGCASSVDRVSVSVSDDGSYTSPSFTPAYAGTYQWVATYSGDANNSSVSSACDDTSGQSVVSPASPTLTTMASSNTVGQPIDDVATLSGGDSPTGWITWNLYKANTGCVKSVDPVSVPVDGDGTYTSPPITPAFAGTYQWVATYSGDQNNSSTSSSCTDVNEQSVVSKASPALATTASSNTVGQPIDDVATLSGGDSPTGSITWNLYAANTGCATSLDSVSVPVTDDGTYTSPSFTPSSAGSYEWVATYSGDINNNSISSSCTDQGEQSVVTSASPPSTPGSPVPPTTTTTPATKTTVSPVAVFRCAHGKVKKHKKVHGKRVTVCVKKRVSPVVRKRRIRPPSFTG